MNIPWNFLKRSTFCLLLVFAAVSVWLITTESGLKTSFWLIKSFFPGQMTTQAVHGKWINQLEIQDLAFESKSFKLKIEMLTIRPLIFKLLTHNLDIADFSFKNAVIETKNATASPLLIQHTQGQLQLNRGDRLIGIQLDRLAGNWAGSPMHGHAKFRMLGDNIEACDVAIYLGEHQLKVTQTHHPNQLDWFLTLKQFNHTDAHLQGFVIAKTLKKWHGEMTTLVINSPYVGQWNLKTPCPFSLAPDQISFGSLQLQQSTTVVTAFANWNNKQGLNAELKIPALSLRHPNLQGEAALHIAINQKINQSPLIKGQLTLSPGNATFRLSEKKQVSYPYQGGSLVFSLDPNALSAELSFQENQHNFIQGSVKALNHSLLVPSVPKNSSPATKFWGWLDQNISGDMTAQWLDLSHMYSFIPGIAKIKGSLEISGKISGTIRHPLFSLQADIKKVAFLVSKQGISIKNLNGKIHGNPYEQFTLEGSGLAGEGLFTLKGAAFFTEEPRTTLELIGKNLQIYNTANIQIIASPTVTLNYTNHTFFLQGDVQISEGHIFIRDNKNYATPSKDVVLVNSNNEEITPPFKMVPSLYLTINNQLHFKGYGLDGIVGGKLAIDQRPDGLLSGNGQLTLIEGKYRLQGATRYIHQGHLLFPPGTLLSDPILDILISQKRVEDQQQGTDVGIYVQGTLQNPLPRLYSNVPLQSADILSRLGLGSTETAGTENQRQLLTQTAFLLSGNANPFIDLLQTNLGLEELNLESREPSKVSTQGGTDTVFVVGRSLTKKLYLQCIQNVMEPVTTVKLKYSLGPYLYTSVETGTEGLGGDITFSMEKD